MAIAVCMLCAVPAGSAQSLWTDEAAAKSVFADRKANGIGDIVTIIINENSSASRTGAASNSKSAETDVKAGVGFLNIIPDAHAKQSDQFKAQGSLNNSNKVSAKITTTVTEVKPNGNLVITGTQLINQNGEEQKITVTGIVRPDDITADNTILSSYVADAKIKIEGKGPIAKKQRQGIITRLVDLIF